jgi:YD repeat-containing protein
LSTIVDSFDCAGRKMSHTVDGLTTDYVYDPGTRLIGQQGTGTWATMAYDPVGNTTLKWNQGQNPMTMSYDPASRLVTQTLGAVVSTYLFDLNGNTSLQVSGGVPTGYAYDKENRMKLVQNSDGTLATNVYSGDGLRRLRQNPADPAPHTIVWDGKDYLGEY